MLSLPCSRFLALALLLARLPTLAPLLAGLLALALSLACSLALSPSLVLSLALALSPCKSWYGTPREVLFRKKHAPESRYSNVDRLKLDFWGIVASHAAAHFPSTPTPLLLNAGRVSKVRVGYLVLPTPKPWDARVYTGQSRTVPGHDPNIPGRPNIFRVLIISLLLRHLSLLLVR